MRKLPPFAAIRAFEAAARHASFKHGAAELNLSATAISHQICRLERLTGRALFVRHTRRVALTDTGRELLATLTPALDAMAKAFGSLDEVGGRHTVTLGAGAIFASRWLAPRLGHLWLRHPEIDLRVHHSPMPVHERLTEFELAVAWGDGHWRGVVSQPLLRIEVMPVLTRECAATREPLDSPSALLWLPLLHHRDQGGWRQWFAAAGVDAPRSLPGVVFDDANVLLQAVLADQGVGLGIRQFITDELLSGRLLQPFEMAIDPGPAYHLVHQPGALKNAATRAVHDWLLDY